MLEGVVSHNSLQNLRPKAGYDETMKTELILLPEDKILA